jgi:hypothetical protein
MQIKGYPPESAIPNLDVGIACKNSQLARRIVEINAKDCVARRGHHTVSKTHAETARLTCSLQFEIAETTVQYDLRFAVSTGFAEDTQGHRTFRGYARQAPVVEFNLRSAVLGSPQLGPFKKRRICRRRISQHLVALKDAHLPIHAA